MVIVGECSLLVDKERCRNTVEEEALAAAAASGRCCTCHKLARRRTNSHQERRHPRSRGVTGTTFFKKSGLASIGNTKSSFSVSDSRCRSTLCYIPSEALDKANDCLQMPFFRTSTTCTRIYRSADPAGREHFHPQDCEIYLPIS